MHYSNKSYETEWSFLNHKKGNKNLRLKDTCTFMIEKLRKKHNFRYEHLWNHDFYAQESNIIFDIFFSIFFRYYFDIFFDIFFFRLYVNSIFCLIRCVDV